MGKRPGRDNTGKWLHSGDTRVYFLLKLNGFGLCPCTDSEKLRGNGLILGIISIRQI